MIRLLKDFRPALLFLGKFVAVYFIGNILYGVYITNWDPQPDPATRLISKHSAATLSLTGYSVTQSDVPNAPRIAMLESGREVLHVFEGCNGINVMIVFLAFLFAFGGPRKALALFAFGGLLVIHGANIVRLSLLYHLAISHPDQFYYFHKYFFTAILYVIVFGLWALWVIRFNKARNVTNPAA